MPAGWTDKRILITVRTYPLPARKGIEVSCTGGITDDGKWIRLFPVPYRFLEEDRRFTKYQWINVSVTKARNDIRPESFTPNLDTMAIGERLSTAGTLSEEWYRPCRDQAPGLVGPWERESACRTLLSRDAAEERIGEQALVRRRQLVR